MNILFYYPFSLFRYTISIKMHYIYNAFIKPHINTQYIHVYLQSRNYNRLYMKKKNII